jgi:endoglucanase
VRIPVSIENILSNNPPAPGVVNRASNRALNLKNFITSLQSIVESLAFRKIGVMISMHRLTNTKSGDNWFDPALGVTQEMFLQAMATISKELCGEDYWNIIGVDLKNEPEKADWGTGTENDFVVGAEKIAKVMHEHCPNWLAFVEGVVNVHTMTLDGVQTEYYDWWGGGLQDAAKKRPQFTIPNKLVWAPHYYTTAVAPQKYFYGTGTSEDYSQYVELGDEELYKRIEATMHDMFGYLVEENTNALVLGEFAGLYAKDAHPMKTTKRTTDLTIRVMMSKNYAGGFMWSLNPESKYEYNPANQKGTFTEGLLMDDWLTPNTEFINAFLPMDAMPDLKPMPCFQVKREVTKKPPTDETEA